MALFNCKHLGGSFPSCTPAPAVRRPTRQTPSSHCRAKKGSRYWLLALLQPFLNQLSQQRRYRHLLQPLPQPLRGAHAAARPSHASAMSEKRNDPRTSLLINAIMCSNLRSLSPNIISYCQRQRTTIPTKDSPSSPYPPAASASRRPLQTPPHPDPTRPRLVPTPPE